MIQSEVFPAKLTINRIIENGVCEKSAILEVADRFGNRSECKKCAADHRQLASWLRELKELKESQGGKVESVSLIEEDGSIRVLPLDRVFITRAKEKKK